MRQHAVDALAPAGFGALYRAGLGDGVVEPNVARGDDLEVEVSSTFRGRSTNAPHRVPHVIGNAAKTVFAQGQQAPECEHAMLTCWRLWTPPCDHRCERRQVGFELRWVSHLRLRDPAPELELLLERCQERVQAAPLGRNDGDDGRSKERGQAFGVDAEADARGGVHHVERNDDRDARLDELQRQIEPALQGCRVDDADHGPRIAFGQCVDGELLLRRARGQAVHARYVDQLDLLRPELQPRSRSVDGHSRVIADVRAPAREGIEQGALPAVGVACDEHLRGGLVAHTAPSGRTAILAASARRSDKE